MREGSAASINQRLAEVELATSTLRQAGAKKVKAALGAGWVFCVPVGGPSAKEIAEAICSAGGYESMVTIQVAVKTISSAHTDGVIPRYPEILLEAALLQSA
jgi:hypothetical protein